MEFVKVKTLTDIKKGDRIMFGSDKFSDAIVKVLSVKVTVHDGTEIIIGKPNKYFNLGMYLEGNSWIKNVRVLREKDENKSDAVEFYKWTKKYLDEHVIPYHTTEEELYQTFKSLNK